MGLRIGPLSDEEAMNYGAPAAAQGLSDDDAMNYGKPANSNQPAGMSDDEAMSFGAPKPAAANDDTSGLTKSTSVLGDIGRTLVSGTASALTSGHEVASRLPGIGGLQAASDAAVEWLTGINTQDEIKAFQKRVNESVTPEQQVSDQKNWVRVDPRSGWPVGLGPAWSDPRSYMRMAGESAPSMLVTMGPSALIARGAFFNAIESGLTREAASEVAAKTALKAGMLSEGLLAGGQSGVSLRDEVNAIPIETLRKSEAFQSMVKQGMSEDQARKALAEDASTKGFFLTGVTTGIFGGTGDFALAKIIGEGVSGNIIKRIVSGTVKGAIGEELEEVPQNVSQQIAENYAVQQALPDRKLTEGVAESFGQGVVGGLMGGPLGAVGGAVSPKEDATTGVPAGATPADQVLGTPESAGGVTAPSAPADRAPAAGGTSSPLPVAGVDNAEFAGYVRPTPDQGLDQWVQPAPVVDEETDRPGSPRLTPADRASPLPNDLIDDGKRLFDEALGIKREEPASTGVPELDTQVARDIDMDTAVDADLTRDAATADRLAQAPTSVAAQPAVSEPPAAALASEAPSAPQAALSQPPLAAVEQPAAAPAPRALSDDEFMAATPDTVAATAAPPSATAPTDAGRAAREARTAAEFPERNEYSVDTEDAGTLNVRVMRRPDRSAVLIDGEGRVIEHNAAFAKDKSDIDLIAYSFEPAGFKSAAPAEFPSATQASGKSPETQPEIQNATPEILKATETAPNPAQNIPENIPAAEPSFLKGFDEPRRAAFDKVPQANRDVAVQLGSMIDQMRAGGNTERADRLQPKLDAILTSIMPAEPTAAAPTGPVRAGTKSARAVTPDILKSAIEILKAEPTHTFDSAVEEAYHRKLGGKPRPAPATEEAMPPKNEAAPATYMREAEKDLPPGYGIAANDKGELAVLDRGGKPIARSESSGRASVDWLVKKGRDHADRTNDWEAKAEPPKQAALKEKLAAKREPAQTASWVIREKATGNVIMETFDRKKVDALNTAKYETVPVQQHLAEFNRAVKEAGGVQPAAAKPKKAAAEAPKPAEKAKPEPQAQREADKPMRPKVPQADAGALFDTQANSEKQDEMFSLSRDLDIWRRKLRDFLKGLLAPDIDLRVGRVPAVLRALGVPSGQVVFRGSKIRKVMNEHGDIGTSTLIDLPNLIADPAMVYEEVSKESDFVIVTDRKTKAGHPIVIAIKSEGVTTKGDQPATIVLTVHPLEDAKDRLAAVARGGRFRYIRDDKAAAGSEPTGANFLRGLQAQPSGQRPIQKILSAADIFKSDDGERFKLGPTGAFHAQAQEVGTRLRAEMDRLGLKDVGLRIAEKLGLDVEGKFIPAQGSYFRKLISVALDAENPDVVLGHEALHALRDLKLFSDTEWAILERQSRRKWMDHYDIRNVYSDFSEDIQVEEGIAAAFSHWYQRGQQFDGLVVKSFRKIKAALRAIGRAFGGDFRSADDVFQQIATGAVGARPRERQTSGEEVFSLRDTEDTGLQRSVLGRRIQAANAAFGQRVMSYLSNGRPTGGESIGGFAARKLTDYLQPVKELIDSVGGAVDSANSYLLARLADDKVVSDVQRAHQTYITPAVEALAQAGASLKDFHDYMYARHAPERNRVVGLRNEPGSQFHDAVTDPGIVGASGMSTNEAQDILNRFAQTPGKLAGLRHAESLIRQMIDADLTAQKNLGMISQQTYDTLTTQWKHYVPLRSEDSVDELGRVGSSGRGFDARGKEFEAATGRFSQADNILAYSVSQVERSLMRQEHTRVGQAMLRFIAQHDPAGTSIAKVYWSGEPATVAGITKAPDVFQRVLNSQGKVVDRKVQPSALKPDMFAVKVGGRTLYIEFNDERVGMALKKMNTISLDVLSKISKMWTGWQSLINTRANPAFVPINALRDALTGGIHLLTHGFTESEAAKVVASIPKAWGALWREARGRPGNGPWDQALRDFVDNGGKIQFLPHDTIEDTIGRLNDTMTKLLQGRSTRQQVQDAFMKFVGDLNDTVENGMRLAAFVAARGKGMTSKQAALLDRDLTVDFKKHGEIGPLVNAWVLFFNASLQGNLNVAANLYKSKKVRRAAYAIATSAVLIDMLNRTLSGGGDDDKDSPYEQMLRAEPWKFERQMVIFTGGSGHYISIPLPYGYNAIYYMGLQASLMAHGDVSPLEALSNTTRVTMDAFNPLGSGSWATMFLPTIFTPGIQLYANKDSFNKTIYPDDKYPDDKFTPDSAKSFPWTPQGYKNAASFINWATGGNDVESGALDIHPEVYQYLTGYVTGGIGRFFSGLADVGQKVATGNFDEIEPQNVPIAKSFFGAAADGTNRAEYYRLREEVQAADVQYDEYRKSQRTSEAQEYKADHLAAVQSISAFKVAEKQLKVLRKQERRITNDDKLSDDERKTQLDALQEREMNAMEKAKRAYVHHRNNPPTE